MSSPYADFFSRQGEYEEAARREEAAGRRDSASDLRGHDARMAGLTEKDAVIVWGVAVDFSRETAKRMSPVEMSRIVEKYVGRLRTLLGEAAFGDLDAYVRANFGGPPEAVPAPPAPPLAPRSEQTLDFGEPAPKVFGDSDFRLSASATSGLRVSYTASGDCAMHGSVVHILSAGKCWVTASQSGDSRFEAAADVEQRIVIAKASQRIEGDAPAAKTYLDPDFPVEMGATSGLAVVFFSWGDCIVGATTVHITGAGTCSFTAHQPGNANYLAARIVDAKFAIAKASQKIEFEEFLKPYLGPYVFPLEARASSGLAVVYGVADGPCAIVGHFLTILDSGWCVVTANQPGDRNFNAAPAVRRTLEIPIPPPRLKPPPA